MWEAEVIEKARYAMPSFVVVPVTPDRWPDVVTLFATSGVMRGCWCMWPRLPREEHQAGDGNQGRLKAIVDAGHVPGLLAYADGQPAGWCSVGPRADYRGFFTAAAAPSTWVIACIFVGASYRGHQLATTLLQAAVDYASSSGARAIEGLPRGWRPDEDLQTTDGVRRLFQRAGFAERAGTGLPMRVRKSLIALP